MPRYPFAFACLALLARLSGAGETADFLVLENPASLEILDRYEQPLASDEKKGLPPFAPFRIVAEQTLLGDGITQVKEVRFDGHPYYLLRSDGAGDPPGVRRYRGGRVLDGREAAAGADLPCTQGAKPGSRPRKLRKGQALQPIFAHGGHAYVKVPGEKAGYAWCPLGGPFVAKANPEREAAERKAEGKGKAATTSGNGLDPGLRSLLGARMESANRTYATYTGAFNKLTGETRQPPRWECAFSPEGMDCDLAGDLRPEELAKSTAVLAEDLRTRLAGRPFAVTLAEREIKVSIRPETPGKGNAGTGRESPRP
jgi:hypothetical protein